MCFYWGPESYKSGTLIEIPGQQLKNYIFMIFWRAINQGISVIITFIDLLSFI